MRLHPAARLLWLLCLAILVARPSWQALALGLVGLLACAWRVQLSPLVALQGLWRLRWLFLTILVFYAWFTPGASIVSTDSRLVPTVEGLAGGVERLLALGYLVVAVQLLLASTSRSWLIAALHWWLRPLGPIGVNADRVALRLVLVLEAAPRLREQIASAAATVSVVPWRDRLGQLGAAMIDDALRWGSEAPARAIRIPRLPPMPAWQWMAPLLLLMSVMQPGILVQAGF